MTVTLRQAYEAIRDSGPDGPPFARASALEAIVALSLRHGWDHEDPAIAEIAEGYRDADLMQRVHRLTTVAETLLRYAYQLRGMFKGDAALSDAIRDAEAEIYGRED